MKYIVAVDCEGVACGVGSAGASLNESRNLPFAQLQATREADAAARALFDAGAEQVIVWDNHGGSLNLHYDLLDERCDIALGTGFGKRFPGIDESFTGVLFIGYHSMDNVVDAAMAHTFSSNAYQWMKINGQEVGELAIDAAVAGEFGVPPIFAASDDKCVAEAQRFFPGITTVKTKDAYGWNAAISKHPKRAVREIYEGVTEAVKNATEMNPYLFDAPIEFEIRFKRLENAESASRGINGAERVDPYTVRRTLGKISDYF